ncbi:MAG: hypothetical protein RL026_1009 [Pseudomonadota bacterium]
MVPEREALQIPGPAGVLQAVLEDPRSALSPPLEAFVVLCHPHPLHGGTMDNKVVTTLARSFHELGLPTLRFNFRGVGQSAGAHDQGEGEVDDALAVITEGCRRWPRAAPWLAGFSFGGRVALRAACRAGPGKVARLVTVAPALTRFAAVPSEVPVPTCPWLVVMGDADELVPAAETVTLVEALRPAPRLLLLPGVGHFFHGQLNVLKDEVLSWARSPS